MGREEGACLPQLGWLPLSRRAAGRAHLFSPKNTGMGSLSLLQGIFPTQGNQTEGLHTYQIYHLQGLPPFSRSSFHFLDGIICGTNAVTSVHPAILP